MEDTNLRERNMQERNMQDSAPKSLTGKIKGSEFGDMNFRISTDFPA